jgi:hypothetical protein
MASDHSQLSGLKDVAGNLSDEGPKFKGFIRIVSGGIRAKPGG